MQKGQRSDFIFISAGFHFLGIGIHGQIVLDWVIFTIGVAHRCFMPLAFIYTNKEWRFLEVGRVTAFLLVLLLYLAMMYKRKSMKKSLFQLENRLTGSDLRYFKTFQLVLVILALSPVIEKTILYLISAYSCDTEISVNSMFDVPKNSTISKVIIGVFCFNEYVIFQEMELACSLYMITFLVLHFVKMKHLDSIASYNSSRWREKILLASSDISYLYEQFEDAFSFILFFKVAFDFTYAFLHIFMFADFNSVSKYIPSSGDFIYAVYRMLRQAVYTILLFAFISWLQEKVYNRCNYLRLYILRKLFANRIVSGNILDDLLFNVLSKKATIWNMLDVSRSTLLTLASVNVAFPVLFAQIENGALNGGRDG